MNIHIKNQLLIVFKIDLSNLTKTITTVESGYINFHSLMIYFKVKIRKSTDFQELYLTFYIKFTEI